MKHHHANLGSLCRFCLIAIAAVLFWSGRAHCQTSIDVYMWVADQMNVRFIPAIPSIHFVDRDALQQVFQRSNRRSFLRWEAEYGEVQARKILDRYLQGVVGLFVPETESIYVFNALSPCRQQAVLAHEITHFFQHIKDGPVEPGAYGAEALHMVREMEAYKVEERYKWMFCGGPDTRFPE